MAMRDPKDVAALIVGDMKPKGMSHDMGVEMDDDSAGEADVDEGEEAAAEDMMAAFEAKDPRALVAAMKAFYDMCSSK